MTHLYHIEPQTLMIENEINQEIYQLYQLTPKEIEIIESGN